MIDTVAIASVETVYPNWHSRQEYPDNTIVMCLVAPTDPYPLADIQPGEVFQLRRGHQGMAMRFILDTLQREQGGRFQDIRVLL